MASPYPLEKILSALKTLEGDFEKALKQMEDAVTRIRELAIYDNLKKREVEANMMAQLPEIDIENFKYHPAMAPVVHLWAGKRP